MKFDISYNFVQSTNQLKHIFTPPKTEGILKLAEMYVKALITRKTTYYDDPTYGTFLVDIAGSNTDLNGVLVKRKVVEAVRSATAWFLSMQINNIVSDEEMLQRVDIAGIDFDLTSNAGKVNISLVLQNLKGKTIVAGVAI